MRRGHKRDFVQYCQSNGKGIEFEIILQLFSHEVLTFDRHCDKIWIVRTIGGKNE